MCVKVAGIKLGGGGVCVRAGVIIFLSPIWGVGWGWVGKNI